MNKIIDLLGLSEFKEKIISLIPTKVSQLDNDSEYAKKQEINDLKKSVSDGKTLVASAITEKGVATAADSSFNTMAENINQIHIANLQEKTVSPTTSAQTVTPDTGKNGLSKVTVNAAPLQAKTVSPSASAQTIKPDSGQYGLSQVTVSAINDKLTLDSFTVGSNGVVAKDISSDRGYSRVILNALKEQEKTVSPSASAQTITPDSGYHVLSKVTVNAAKLQNKSVTPTSSIQTIYPDSGFYGLGAVSVAATLFLDITTCDFLGVTSSMSTIPEGYKAYVFLWVSDGSSTTAILKYGDSSTPGFIFFRSGRAGGGNIKACWSISFYDGSISGSNVILKNIYMQCYGLK